MPSAKEIETEGLDVGDGLIGITRNVEEISLDVIDIFIQNEILYKYIQELQDRIILLEKNTK
jgi:hypothetical protein